MGIFKTIKQWWKSHLSHTKLGEEQFNGTRFGYVKFEDKYGLPCSMQQSSITTERCMWLGVDDAKPVVKAKDAIKLGIQTHETVGWIDYNIPKEVLLHTRMHLTEKQVVALIAHLRQWLKNDTFNV